MRSASENAGGFNINYDREGRITNLDRRGDTLNEEMYARRFEITFYAFYLYLF